MYIMFAMEIQILLFDLFKLLGKSKTTAQFSQVLINLVNNDNLSIGYI